MSNGKITYQVFTERDGSGFEVAFTALICTLVLQTPRIGPLSEQIANLSVLGLILIALIRFMTNSSDFRSGDSVFSLSQVAIEAITIGSILYILTSIIEISNMPDYIVYACTLAFPIVLLAAHEWILRDFLIFCAAFGHDICTWAENMGEKSEYPVLFKYLNNIFADIVEHCMSLSNAEIPPRLSVLEQYKSDIQSPSPRGSLKLFIPTLLTLVGMLIIPAAALFLLLGTNITQIAIALFVVVYLRLLVRFWYVAYGLIDLQSSKRSLPQLLVELTFYAVLFLFLFN